MSPLSFLTEHGPELALGCTALLVVGCLGVLASREPLHRKRLGELTAWGLLVFLVLAAVPLPRFEGTGRSVAVTAPESPAAPTWAAGVAEGWVPAKVVTPVMEAPARSGPTRVLREPEPAGAGIPWPWFYLAGSGLAVLYLLLGITSLACLLLGAAPAPPWVLELLPEERRCPRVVMTRKRCRPFCLLGRTIVLPASLCRGGRREQLRLVLLHEVAHLRNGDLPRQVAFTLLLPVLYLHPLYWWLRHQTRLASEMLADDQAAGQAGRTHYARELIELAEEDAGHRFTPLGAAGIFGSTSEFYRRIAMLLEREHPLSTRCSRPRRVLQAAGTLLLVAGASGLWGLTPAVAQEAPGRTDTVTSLRQERDRLLEEITRLRMLVDAKVKDFVPGLPGVSAGADEEAADPTVDRLQDSTSTTSFPGRPRLPGMVENEAAVGSEEPASSVSSANPFQAPARDPLRGLDQPILDAATLQLLTQAIELVADLEGAEEELGHLQKLADARFVDERELAHATREVATLHRKRQLFMTLIKSEVVTAQQEIELLEERRDQYAKDSAGYREMEVQMGRVLRRIELLMSVR